MQQTILQKSKYVIKELAEDFLLLEAGDRVNSVSYYQERFQVARGTVQNAIAFLQSEGAISLVGRGRNGAIATDVNYAKLQTYCMPRTVLGVMPLSYTITSQGLATGLYEALNKINCSLVYTRGASIRIQMVLERKCQFALCSRNSAEIALRDRQPIKILFDFGAGTYMPDHALVFRQPDKNCIEPHMRVAYDPDSSDQKDIIDLLTKDVKSLNLVKVKTFQTLNALRSGAIDVGVWNVDELLLNTDLHYCPIAPSLTEKFSTAVLVAAKDDIAVERMLQKYIDVESVRSIQKAVKEGRIFADF